MPSEKRVAEVLPSRVLAQEFMRNIWCVKVENETDPATLTDWGVWVTVSHLFKPNDRLEIMPDDATWFSEFIVRNVEGNRVALAEIRMVKFSDAAIPTEETGGYLIKWRGPARRFGVVLKSSGELTRDGFATKGDAFAFIMDTKRNFAA